LKELGVQLIVADMTKTNPQISKDLSRADRRQIPVNLIYPSNYPEEPAILLEGIFFAKDALKALERANQLSQKGKVSSKP
jgi:thiol:disulfide interchange protein